MGDSILGVFLWYNTRMGGSDRTFWGDFKTFFLKGLGILLPSILTLAILLWAYGFLKNNVAEPLNSAVRGSIIRLAPRVMAREKLPEWFSVPDDKVREVQEEAVRRGERRRPAEAVRHDIRAQNFALWWRERWYLQAIGFIVALLLVYLAGVFVGHYIGRRAVARLEEWITKLPVLKQVYPNVKQVVEFLIGGGEKRLPSKRVVAVQYPRPGIWSIGLHTGGTLKALQAVAGEECITIFIPSSPTPFTGYTITVPKKDVIDLPLTLDEALRFVVSGGVLVPEAQQAGSASLPAGSSGPDLAGGPKGPKMEGGGGHGDEGVR